MEVLQNKKVVNNTIHMHSNRILDFSQNIVFFLLLVFPLRKERLNSQIEIKIYT